MGGLLNHGCPAIVVLDRNYRGISPACLKLLLDGGANHKVVDCGGNTALHVFQNDLSKIKMLLEGGADATAQNNVGDTPLHMAAMTGQITLAKMLLLNGASASMPNSRNMSSLDVAAAAGLSACFKSMFNLATKPVGDHQSVGDQQKWKEASEKWKEAYEGLKSNMRAVCHGKIQELTREE